MDKHYLVIKEHILSKIKPLIENPPCFSTIIDLDCSITNNSIIGIWNYYRTSSKLFQELYFIPKNNLTDEESKIYSDYYNAHIELQQLFDSHITSTDKHVILFYNPNDTSVIILYKPNLKNKNPPFWIIEVDKGGINSDFIFSNTKLDLHQIKINCYV